MGHDGSLQVTSWSSRFFEPQGLMPNPSSIVSKPLLQEVVAINARSCGKVLALLFLLIGLGCTVLLSLALSTNSRHPMVGEPGITMAWKVRPQARTWRPMPPAG